MAEEEDELMDRNLRSYYRGDRGDRGAARGRGDGVRTQDRAFYAA